MIDQPNTGSGVAPQGTTPTPLASGGTDFPALLKQYEAQLQAAQGEGAEWKKRYDGQQSAMQKKAEDLKAAEARENALRAEFEGFKGTTDAQVADLLTRVAANQKLADERAAKLGEYELRETTRSLISKDFAALLPDFDNDPVVQAGVLALAKTAEPDALKAALTASLAAKQNGQQAAVAATLRGGSTPAPASGTPASTSVDDLQKQMRGMSTTDPKYAALMDKLIEAMNRENQ